MVRIKGKVLIKVKVEVKLKAVMKVQGEIEVNEEMKSNRRGESIKSELLAVLIPLGIIPTSKSSTRKSIRRPPIKAYI